MDPLTCLIDARQQVSNKACKTALVKTINRAFRFYHVGTAATRACDDAAAQRCGATDDSHRFQTPGSVLGCLQRATAHVSDACWVGAEQTTCDTSSTAFLNTRFLKSNAIP